MRHRRLRLRSLRTIVAGAAAAVLLTAWLPSAAAVTPDQIRYLGVNVAGKTLPDHVLPLELWSSTPATALDLFLNSKRVASDQTIEARDGYWLGTVNVDLRGLSGRTKLTMRVTTPGSPWRNIAVILFVAPQPAPIDPTPIPIPIEPVPVPRPGPTNTGVPAGTVLTPSGPLSITEPGTVIDGLDVAGCVTVLADNVTIRNTRITCLDSIKHRAVRMDGVRSGLLLEDVEIDGGGLTDIGVDASRTTIRRANIHGVGDGVRLGTDITIEASWIHDMVRIGALHPDAIQGISAQNIVIRGNTLDPRTTATGDFTNSALMLGSETGAMFSTNVLVENNYLDGGNCTINIHEAIASSNIVVRANRFGATTRYNCSVLTPLRVPMGADNVLDASGLPIEVQYTDD
ncbi:right-handed parallel beta-helix repeat-containing protein [Pengzhenrongella sicca]|uniref:Right handed beta helix domain-containing protein n=1 Tax=Pengzhenrongella sicca TaxID=2819238 RepID=A0A8A4ZE18_9MICO|nr:hypothetical protein [Pengzhenrongella sicca]QTE29651.1 hypothetical protein J4E96_00885 [Pengzhenrongella sicca]